MKTGVEMPSLSKEGFLNGKTGFHATLNHHIIITEQQIFLDKNLIRSSSS